MRGFSLVREPEGSHYKKLTRQNDINDQTRKEVMLMAKSRSESSLREALTLLSLRGAEGDEAISKDSPRGTEMSGPGKKALPHFLAPEGRGFKVRVKGQPDMRQA